ncbi:MAG: glycosyltransferase [Bacteroidales bacterium]|nr:glycosyltransferase [Bacteroidales bacterium]
MIITLAIITVIYALLILAFGYYWREEEDAKSFPADLEKTLVSVIVAFRNEEKNIPALIDSLLAQTYTKCEFVLVDDHSDDNSLAIAKTFSDSRIKIISASDEVIGKKAALKFGYESSLGEILFFTDADCVFGSRCIETIVAKMHSEKSQMVCGPVCYFHKKGFFQGLMQLEFLSLTGSGASGFFMGRPFMCNGANLAVDRKVYAEADLNPRYSSGDDVFLLHYAHSKYKVSFVQSSECIVETQGPDGICDFFKQRIRWASKAGGYKNGFAIFVAALIFLMSLALIVAFVAGCINPIYFIVYFCLLMMKLVVDTYFIIPVLRFYRMGKLWWAILPLTIIYPIYIVSVAVASLFYKPMWKGRKIYVKI